MKQPVRPTFRLPGAGIPARLAELFDKQPEKLLALLVGGQVLLWTFLPALHFAGLPLDMLENVGWSRDLEWGYYKHPPLQVWATAAMLKLSGGALWSLYLLGPLSVALAFLAIYSLGSDIAERRAGLLAALLFSLVFYANFAVTEFNANVVQLPIWGWAAVALWRGLGRKGFSWWLLLGVLLALGIYAKYSSAILVVALILAAVALPEGRKALRTPGPYAAAALALLLVVPHVAWLVDHDWLPVAYAENRADDLSWLARVTNPLGFLVTQIADFAGAILILALGLLPWRPRGRDDTVFAAAAPGRRYVLLLATVPLGLAMLLPLLAGQGMRDMWGGPLLIWVPLAVLLLLKPAYRTGRLKAMLAGWAILFVAAPIIAALISSSGPSLGIAPQRTSLPDRRIADSLVAAWRGATRAPLGIVAGDTWESGVVSTYAADAPSVFVAGDPRINPWIDTARIEREGVLVVWPEAYGDMPPQYQQLGPFAAQGTVAIRVPGAPDDALALRWAARRPAPPKTQ